VSKKEIMLTFWTLRNSLCVMPMYYGYVLMPTKCKATLFSTKCKATLFFKLHLYSRIIFYIWISTALQKLHKAVLKQSSKHYAALLNTCSHLLHHATSCAISCGGLQIVINALLTISV